MAAFVLALVLGQQGIIEMSVTFEPSAALVDAYDFVEVALRVDDPPAGINPFADVEVRGAFACVGETAVAVDGFCDSDDGSVYRVRFMPRQVGDYVYTVTYRQGETLAFHSGTFAARDAGCKGLVKADPEHPFHFLYEGTGEHYFYNSTTTYAMAGLREPLIEESLERLARLGINRVRAALYGPRVASGEAWCEPVVNSDDFRFIMNPWPAARPDSVEDPGFDVSRLNLDHWRKYEKLLGWARERNINVSVIFYVDGARPGTYPFRETGGGPDEQRYYRYAAARFAAFSNVMWDVTNEYRLFRDDAWAETMGTFLRSCDPYGHVMSVHGHGDFRFRTSAWADFAMYQHWDEEGGYEYLLANRREQEATGRPIPQVNEEYGYEGHYPTGWGGKRVWPARTAENRRKVAWMISMAGCYQTTGERADNALGGWINGRGDDSMVMLPGYARMVAFFTRFPWWNLEPRPELASGAMCLAQPGERYVIYLRAGGQATLSLEPGDYRAQWFDPRSGEYLDIPGASGPAWTSPAAPDAEDWVLLLERR